MCIELDREGSLFKYNLKKGNISSGGSSEMQRFADAADISVLFFSSGANFWAVLGHFWAISTILGHVWANLGNFGSFLCSFGYF